MGHCSNQRYASLEVIYRAGSFGGREDGYASPKQMSEMDPVKSTVMLKSGLQSAPEKVVNMSNSMFQTGLGRTVNISSAGLLRAKALLGLEESCDRESFYGVDQKQKQSTSTEAWENPSHLETRDPRNLTLNSSTKSLIISGVKSDSCGSESIKFPDLTNSASKPPPVKFQTAGGRSISVSSDALQRARSLLGNPEFDLDEASAADPLFSLIDNGNSSSSQNKRDEFNTPLLYDREQNDASFLRNFTSPPRSISNQKHSYTRFGKLGQGNNLTAQFDAEAAVSNSKRPYNGLTCDRKPAKGNSSQKVDCSENTGQLKIDLPKRSVSGALVDISNTMNVDHRENKEYCGEKRRLRRISSVSPFKKPRNSFVTPLNKNNSSLPNGKVS